MSGIRVNIQTGEVEYIHDGNKVKEVRVCERCHHNYETRRYSKTRFCSMSCAKTGQNNRLGAKHTQATKEKMKKKIQERREIESNEIVPFAKIKNRVKKPHFVKDPHQWANAIYGKYRVLGKIPHNMTDEYGLYKYGEWLHNNERYTSIWQQD